MAEWKIKTKLGSLAAKILQKAHPRGLNPKESHCHDSNPICGR